MPDISTDVSKSEIPVSPEIKPQTAQINSLKLIALNDELLKIGIFPGILSENVVKVRSFLKVLRGTIKMELSRTPEGQAELLKLSDEGR